MWHRRAFLGVIGAVFVAGCGPKFNTTPPPKVYPVKGKVLLASGKPVSGGVITFHPKTTRGAEASGEIGKDGSFQLTTIVKNDGAMPGSYTVSVNPHFKDGRYTAAPASPVPPKFGAPGTSGLTVEVEAKDNDLKIELK
jgi:hypothetical protein